MTRLSESHWYSSELTHFNSYFDVSFMLLNFSQYIEEENFLSQKSEYTRVKKLIRVNQSQLNLMRKYIYILYNTIQLY